MKIVVVTGSPHKAGTSALLADKFIEGAESKGHEVFRFNAAFEDIHPCRGCDACGMNGETDSEAGGLRYDCAGNASVLFWLFRPA